MGKHFSTVHVHGDGNDKVTITIRCQDCGVTELPPIAPAHLTTLARTCWKLAKSMGLADEGMSTLIGRTDDPEDTPRLQSLADEIITAYRRRRGF